MAHHVGTLEVRKCDIVDTAQNLLNVSKTATTTHQVALAQVAGNHELGVKTQARQEHLHLLGRGILRLVEHHEGITQRAAAHVGKRGDLDHATLHKLIGALAIHHVKKGVVERTHVGIYLFLKGTGQKAQILPRLDNRTRQDQTAHLVTLERGNGERHGQIGLTGTGRTQAKGDGMRANGIHVALLPERLGTNDAAAIRKQHVIAKRRSLVLTVAQDGQAARDIVGRQRAPGGRLAKSVFEKTRHEFDLVRVTAHGDAIATGDHMGANQALERTKDTVAGAQNA